MDDNLLGQTTSQDKLDEIAERYAKLQTINDMQRFLEGVAEQHEKLRLMAHHESSTPSFLRIVEALDTALKESIASTGELAQLFLIRR